MYSAGTDRWHSLRVCKYCMRGSPKVSFGAFKVLPVYVAAIFVNKVISHQEILYTCDRRGRFVYTRHKIQDTRFFTSGKLPIVHDYTMFNKMLVTYL